MSENNTFTEEQDDDFDIVGILFKYLRHWYWFVLTVALGYAGAYLYLKRFTPIYQVNATLLIKDDKFKNKRDDVMEDLSAVGNKQIDNEIEVLRSRALAEKVIDALNLTVTYWQEGKSRDSELYNDSPIKINIKQLNGTAYGTPLYVKSDKPDQYQLLDKEQNSLGFFAYSQLIKSSFGQFRVFRNNKVTSFAFPVKVIFQSREGLVNSLTGGLQIAPKPKTSFLGLGLETAVPDKGKAILAKLLEEYAYSSLADKNSEASNTLRFIEERLKLVTSELGDVEQNVEQYRRAKGINDLSGEANLFLSKVEENDTKLNELDIQEKVINGVESYINSTQIGNIAPATLMVNDPVLSNYISQYSQLEAERNKLSQTVQAGNPYLETVISQMRNVKQAIRENLGNQKANLQVSRNSFLALNNRLAGSISTIPRKEREFVGIKRQAGIKENLYLLLLQKREETALSYASTVTDSRIVDMPYSTGGPIKPDRNNIFMIALLIGLAIPFAVISLKELLTNTVQSKKDIEKKTNLKVFAEISKKPKGQEGEVIDVSSRSFMSEQIRMIRSNMQYLFANSKEGVAKTMMFTSSVGGEGKSFVTLNIAVSLALLNKKVIILGFDLRKPKINEYLGVDNKKGLSNFLIGKAKSAEIIQATNINNVFIIPSGAIPPNPSELISNGKLRDLLDEIQYLYDYILIDTPPIGLVTDAILLEPYADVCFYIVRHEKTPKIYLNTINELNKKKTFKSLNLIFNAVDYKNSSDYGYGYGYGYGYYGEEKSRSSWFQKLMGNKTLKKKKRKISDDQ